MNHVNDAMVEIVDLVKKYKKSTALAVDKVTFAVRRGELFGLLGPNGAGKTTTIGILTTRVHPTSGHAKVAGIDVDRDPVGARRHLGVVPQRNNLDRSLSILQNLLFHAAYHGVPTHERMGRATKLLEQFGLREKGNDRIDMFSGGQAQRAMVARALMHEPDVLFLDEPSTGLDPAARLFVWDRIRELKASGVTIVLTTHDMDEAASLSDRVGIMDHGHLLALDTPSALTRTLPGKSTLEITTSSPVELSPHRLTQCLGDLGGVERVELLDDLMGSEGDMGEEPSGGKGGHRVRLFLTGSAPPMIAPVASGLADLGAALHDVHVGTPSLEDVFINLTGRLLR